MNSIMTIKELGIDDRPREKMILNGPTSLSDSELLAILLRTGTKDLNAVDLSRQILNDEVEGLKALMDMSIEELCNIKGIGIGKATVIKAALELGKRISKNKIKKISINKPWDVYENYIEDLRYLKKEIFKAILLNTKNEIITDSNIFVGTLNSSIVHPREVFNEAIKRSANSIIIMHNHPSGNPAPSEQDKMVTNRLIKCGQIIGIDILDHIIIGDGCYFSFKQEKIF